MEKFQEARELAKEKLKIADHMLYSTYPMIKDPRLLITIMDNIFLALSNSMSAILYYEQLFKRISNFTDNFDNKFNIFKDKIIKRYNINIEYISLIQDIKHLITSHRKSPVEFSRKDMFVICDGVYRTKKITVNDMKKFVSKAKLFIDEMNNITSKNEQLFR